MTKVGLGKFESLDLGAQCYSAVEKEGPNFFLVPETLFGFLTAGGTLLTVYDIHGVSSANCEKRQYDDVTLNS